MNVRKNIRAFTLIEMLVVVFIIAIVVSIIVAVAGRLLRDANANKTRLNMKVILLAIETYRDPVDANGNYPADSNPVPPPNPETDADAGTRSADLYAKLMSDPRTSAKLASLPKDAISGGKFVDGWGKPIAYYSNLGAGGGPLLLSPGGDGKWDTTDDNIRSDGK